MVYVPLFRDVRSNRPKGTVVGVFGNLLGGFIADILAKRFGYHGRPLSDTWLQVLVITSRNPWNKGRLVEHNYIYNMIRTKPSVGDWRPPEAGRALFGPGTRPEACSVKAQISVAVGIPLIYLWFAGIPPGSDAAVFGTLDQTCGKPRSSRAQEALEEAACCPPSIPHVCLVCFVFKGLR